MFGALTYLIGRLARDCELVMLMGRNPRCAATRSIGTLSALVLHVAVRPFAKMCAVAKEQTAFE